MFDAQLSPQPALDASAWLAAIIDSSDDAIVSKTLDGIITSWNATAESMFGFSAEEAIGQPITIIIPPERLGEEREIIAKIRSGEPVKHFETKRQRRDGSFIDVSLTVSPVRDSAGVIQGASKCLRDITDRKLAEARQKLLLREMDHRIKNLFMVSAGLVKISARAATTKDELAAILSGRIYSLARAHALTLLNPDEEMGGHSLTSLTALLGAILEPYEGQFTIHLTGEDAPIDSACLSSLALVLHEFATNAAKYGALSAEGGHLTVNISTGSEVHRLTWSERGGPTPTPEQSVLGFGSKLEEAMLRSLGGTIERSWSDEGLVITLTMPTHRFG